MKTITSYFKRLRELTLVEGDKHWIKCNVVARKDGEVKILFEYDDDLKWKITPDNFEQAYEILVEDLFPEILKDKT